MSTETMEIVTLCEALPRSPTLPAFSSSAPPVPTVSTQRTPRRASRHLHAKAQTARRKGLSKEFTGDIEKICKKTQNYCLLIHVFKAKTLP
jgi:hypothetical protein